MITSMFPKGLIFDKDGTLFDFNATWGPWARQMMESETGGDAALLARLADALGYDLLTQTFRPGSVVIAGTVDVAADHSTKRADLGPLHGVAWQQRWIGIRLFDPLQNSRALGQDIAINFESGDQFLRIHRRIFL